VVKFAREKETIHPAKAVSGGVEPPGDKSISHRYAMLAGLAEGISELRHFSAAVDCHSTPACMKALGADVKIEKDSVKVTGRGTRGPKAVGGAGCGNSGTTMRLLAEPGGAKFNTRLTGDDSP
jgi:3-phosphoshikimate 1-carboxyvinyltransferase